MMMEDFKNRLMKLELLYMEQEDVVQTLSHLVYQQDDKIARLQKQLVKVTEKLSATEEPSVKGEDAPPPHY
jgi:uncharacterized coiled-coil protein SlyX